MAKEKGLEPLAALLFAQERDCPRPEEAARDYVDPEKGVETVADALQGASDIIAEQISDDAAIRKSASRADFPSGSACAAGPRPRTTASIAYTTILRSLSPACRGIRCSPSTAVRKKAF